MDYEQLAETSNGEIKLGRNAIGQWCLMMNSPDWLGPIRHTYPSREAAIKDALLTVGNMKARDWAKPGKATGWVLMQSDLEAALGQG